MGEACCSRVPTCGLGTLGGSEHDTFCLGVEPTLTTGLSFYAHSLTAALCRSNLILIPSGHPSIQPSGPKPDRAEGLSEMTERPG